MNDTTWVKFQPKARMWTKIDAALEDPGRHHLIARYRKGHWDDGKWVLVYAARPGRFIWRQVADNMHSDQIELFNVRRLTARGMAKAVSRFLRKKTPPSYYVEFAEEYAWAM